MKKNYLLCMLAFGLTIFSSCNSTKQEKNQVAEIKAQDVVGSCCDKTEKSCCSGTGSETSELVQVVYFHNERRCATCMAVEEVSKEVIAVLDSSKVSFASYTIGDAAGAEIEQKYKVAGQTLLVIGKDSTMDLTNTAFMNARVNPDQFKKDLSSALNL